MILEAIKKGRYRVLYPLTRGSLNEVYVGEDTITGRQVVIKLLWVGASSQCLVLLSK
jgi:hypothetical protein